MVNFPAPMATKLISSLTFLTVLLLGGIAQGFDDDLQAKQSLIDYIGVFQAHGIDQIGSSSPLQLEELIQQIESTIFSPISPEEFEKRKGKTRRSAFYTTIDNQDYIFFNSEDPPTPRLFLHEILRDNHYEISNALGSIHSLLLQSPAPEYKEQLIAVLLNSAGTLVDRHGIGADSPHQWLAPQVASNDRENSKLQLVPGGDISGGGGDGGGFEFKSRVLLRLLEILRPLYRNELGYFGTALDRKLGNIHFFLSIKLYVETDHALNSGDPARFNFGTDAIERLLFFPYLIQVPPGPYSEAQIEAAVGVILQSDLFREIPSMEKRFNSPCYCVHEVNGEFERQRLGFLCPDPEKTHPALHELMDFYKKTTEAEFSCQLEIGEH